MSYQLAIYVDQDKCISCNTCHQACYLTSDSEINVIQNRVQPTIGPEHFFTTCVHCKNPICVAVCPEKNYQKRHDGIVIRKANRCQLCLRCVNSCPFGAINLHPKTNNVMKCDFCVDRIDVGTDPLCIDSCITGALSLVKIEPSDQMKHTTFSMNFDTPIMEYASPSIIFSEKRTTTFFRRG